MEDHKKEKESLVDIFVIRHQYHAGIFFFFINILYHLVSSQLLVAGIFRRTIVL